MRSQVAEEMYLSVSDVWTDIFPIAKQMLS